MTNFLPLSALLLFPLFLQVTPAGAAECRGESIQLACQGTNDKGCRVRIEQGTCIAEDEFGKKVSEYKGPCYCGQPVPADRKRKQPSCRANFSGNMLSKDITRRTSDGRSMEHKGEEIILRFPDAITLRVSDDNGDIRCSTPRVNNIYVDYKCQGGQRGYKDLSLMPGANNNMNLYARRTTGHWGSPVVCRKR